MSTPLVRVIAAEGWASAFRRSAERIEETWRLRRTLWRGRQQPIVAPLPLLNVCGMPVHARLGGLPIQLRARLYEEAAWREVALWQPGLLEVGTRTWRIDSLHEAVRRTGAGTVHLEGSFGLDIEAVLHLPQRIVLSLHDLDLLRQPAELRGRLFARASAVIFPSDFLRNAYAVAGHVIAPGVHVRPFAHQTGVRNRIAFAGSVKPLKGGALLPDIIRAVPAQWHVFGGGDADLLGALRVMQEARLHGWYRAGNLPDLLSRQRIGLVVLPSIVPESFCLALSECWLAGIPVITFDHGAPAERIRAQGGGWLVPLHAGAEGIAAMVRRWLSGELHTETPSQVPMPIDAAGAHRDLYLHAL